MASASNASYDHHDSFHKISFLRVLPGHDGRHYVYQHTIENAPPWEFKTFIWVNEKKGFASLEEAQSSAARKAERCGLQVLNKNFIFVSRQGDSYQWVLVDLSPSLFGHGFSPLGNIGSYDEVTASAQAFAKRNNISFIPYPPLAEARAKWQEAIQNKQNIEGSLANLILSWAKHTSAKEKEEAAAKALQQSHWRKQQDQA